MAQRRHASRPWSTRTFFIRLHVLHHAAEGEIYGQWMIDELARHGYRMSPGTLYPMLRSMEAKGYLTSEEKRSDGSTRRLYTATPFGLQALDLARSSCENFSAR